MIIFVAGVHVLIVLIILGFGRLGRKIFYHLEKIDNINYEIRENHYKYHSDQIQTLHRDLKAELLHLQAIIIQIPKKDREDKGTKKKVHHRARTKEQKEHQSAKRKEWWAKKRRESINMLPGDIVITQPLDWQEFPAEQVPSNKSP